MCLRIKKNQEVMTVQEDIKVWKIYRRIDDNPYLLSYYREAKTYFGVQERVEFGIQENIFLPDFSEIEEGYHSFKYIGEAKSFYNNRNHFCSWSEIVLVECIIPKGSQYYLGTFGIRNNLICYASDQLIVEQEITI